MFPFDESYSWEAGVPPQFQTFWKDDTILLARWVSFYILKLWIPHTEGFTSICKDTAL